MAIVAMKHLRLVGLESEREALLKALQDMGCVEVSGVDGAEDALHEGFARPDDRALLSAQESARSYRTALAALDRYAPEKKGMFRKRAAVTREEFFSAENAEAAKAAADALNDRQRRLGEIESERTKEETLRASLAPWLTLDVPLDREDGALCAAFGTVGIAVTDEALNAVCADFDGLALWQQASADRSLRYLFIACHESVKDRAMAALREIGFSPVSFRGLHGTAKENDERAKARLDELSREKQGIEAHMAGLGDKRALLLRASDRAAITLRREEAKSRLVETDKAFLLEGWLPADRCGALEKALAPFTCAVETREPTEDEYPQVPVQLRNNKLTRPLHMVTEMYSLPAYDGVDPNPLMAPFFILFYGIMMADMGYGILMILASIIITKKSHPKGTSGHMFGLMFSCGISTFIMGALTGGFFGDFLPQLVGIINPDTTFKALPSLFTPLDDTISILLGAMVLGFIQIVTGMAVSFVEKLKKGEIMDAVWEELTWWIVFAGIACMALGVTNIVLYVGLGMVVVGSGWSAKGFGKVTAIFGSVYNNVTGYFGDILSYSRLMTLMLAGSVIASVFNTLGAIPGNVVFFLIVSALGNGLNFALNLLSCYVHDLRLQCLEYFGKFYKDGGKPFEPLAINTKYVDIQS